MSDLKAYKVHTKDKRTLKRPGATDLSNNQIVRFKEKVVNGTPWIKNYIAQGYLVEVGSDGKPLSAAKEVEVVKTSVEVKVESPVEEIKVEAVVVFNEEVVAEETPVEEVELPKEMFGEEDSSLDALDSKKKKKKKKSEDSSNDEVQ